MKKQKIDKKNMINSLLKLSSSSPIDINETEPISGLIKDFPDIESILQKENLDIIKLLYNNKKKIHNILYNEEEIINLDSIFEKKDLSNSFCFYLILLLKDNNDIINYDYSLDSIKNANAKINNNENINIINPKLIIELIKNYKQTNNYDEEDEEENKELKKMKNESLNKIKNSLDELKKFDLILDEETIKQKKIDKIYIDIIKMLIEKNKIDNNEILDKLDLKNINITKTMI